MKKVISIIGARPEFMQCAPLRTVFAGRFQELLIHTGQHFDYSLSSIHVADLNMTPPDVDLGVGSGPFGAQLGDMIDKLQKVFSQARPDFVIVRGDTNSTLAGALAAVRMGIPLVHIESGERSHDKSQPEEQNRIMVDRVSDLHFCVNSHSADNLRLEGITVTSRIVGDVMLDSFLRMSPLLAQVDALNKFQLTAEEYAVMTIHRAENTDNPERLRNILQALKVWGGAVLFPVHPRTKKVIGAEGISSPSNVRIIDPLGYLEMLALISKARIVITDSGGVQREAYFMKRPCVTCRETTEWVGTVTSGWNVLVGSDIAKISQALADCHIPDCYPELFGDGNAAMRICEELERHF